MVTKEPMASDTTSGRLDKQNNTKIRKEAAFIKCSLFRSFREMINKRQGDHAEIAGAADADANIQCIWTLPSKIRAQFLKFGQTSNVLSKF